MEKIRAAMWHTKPFFPTSIICNASKWAHNILLVGISPHPIKYNNQVYWFPSFVLSFSNSQFGAFFFFLGEQVSLLPTELGFFFNCQCLILQFNNNLNRPTFPPLTHQSSPPPLFHIP